LIPEPALELSLAANRHLKLNCFAGVDEVGRGCLFGPVWAAAVVLKTEAFNLLPQLGVTDSKALSPKRRAALVPLIQSQLSSYGYGQASAAEIDRIGIRAATELAMLRALQRLQLIPELLLVDGSLKLRPWLGPQQTMVRGDSSCLTIACASILAKQGRDALLNRLAHAWPGYGLEQHHGYGTLKHRQALLKLGPSPLHRLSFALNTNFGNHLPVASQPGL
jgi:ribonuclease HII